jgi:uroporphyrinogen-III synthase
MPRIFISRQLPSNSAFREIMAPLEPVFIQDQPLIDLIPIPFYHLEPCDWIFFSSKNAVSFFFKQLKLLSLKVSSELKWGTIGLGTSKELLKYQIHADFSGNGSPEEVGLGFLPLAEKKIILFPSAKNSKESIQKIVRQKAGKLIQLPVYDNLPKQDFQIEEADIYIFTSPLNVLAFSGNYSLADKHCIAIGATTARELELSGALTFTVSPFPTEESLARTALHWFKNQS